VLTGKRPSFGDKGKIIDDIARPARPPDPNEWVSGDVWSLIFRCLSASLNERPDLGTIMNTLDDAGDAVELRRRGLGEEVLVCFLNDCRDGPDGDQDVTKVKAQWFVDELDSVRQFGNRVSQMA